MKPHFVCFLKEGKPLAINGKTMIYNLLSSQGGKAFNYSHILLSKKYPQLISIAETKGEYRIQTRPLSTGFVAHRIRCEKFPSVCVPTNQVEIVRELSRSDLQ